MTKIQWYPGHMAKAKKEISEKLKYVDIIYEIIDARAPLSSHNPMLDSMINKKPRLLILNKADLADKNMTNKWIKYYESKGISAICLDSKHYFDFDEVYSKTKKILKDKINKLMSKGLKRPNIKAMCVGVPNVGKSTFLNKIVNKKIARTSNLPGLTKKQQWLKSDKNLFLLDTPGILWPSFDNEITGIKLSLINVISETIYNYLDLSVFLIDFMKKNYIQFLNRYYVDINMSSYDILLFLSKKYGLTNDYENFSKKIVMKFRRGKLGNITLDNLINFI